MKIGGGEKWRQHMMKVDEAFIEAVLEVWDRCRSRFASDSREDAITNQLVLLLKRRRSNPLPFRITLQPSEVEADANGNAIIAGRHDIRLDFALDDDASLVYECKRLNVVKNGKKSSLATEYVSDGMMRFVTCQYSPQVRQGGMLGYVMNGDLDDAAAKVNKATNAHAGVLALEGMPVSFSGIKAGTRCSSEHRRAQCASPFRIHHLLLAV